MCYLYLNLISQSLCQSNERSDNYDYTANKSLVNNSCITSQIQRTDHIVLSTVNVGQDPSFIMKTDKYHYIEKRSLDHVGVRFLRERQALV